MIAVIFFLLEFRDRKIVGPCACSFGTSSSVDAKIQHAFILIALRVLNVLTT